MMKLLITGGSGFIGTNAIEEFTRRNGAILNYSLHPPLNPAQMSYWRQGDILDASALRLAFTEFRPDYVLHLAARTDCDENTTVEDGYRVNTEGTRNVLDAIRTTPSVERSIITSTQFVCAPGRLPANETDDFPADKCLGSMAHALPARVLARTRTRSLRSSGTSAGHSHVCLCEKRRAPDREDLCCAARSGERQNALRRRSADQPFRLGQWFLAWADWPGSSRHPARLDARPRLGRRHSHLANRETISYQ